MGYRPATFEVFQHRLWSNYYPVLWKAQQAIRSMSWGDADKAKAYVLVNNHFQVGVSGPTLVEALQPEQVAEALVHLYRAIETMPSLRGPLASVLKYLEPEHRSKPKPVAKKVTYKKPPPPASSDTVGEVPPMDVSTMFSLPDDSLEPDADEGPIIGSDPDEVARACSPRPDLENAIAEGDADDRLDDKQKAGLRAATLKLIEMRDRKKAGN